jgi:hypothetical protein
MKIHKPEVINLTVRMAEKFLALSPYKGQRALRPNSLNFLSTKMRDGSFHGSDIGIAQLNYNRKQEILINGQHTCNSVIMANISQYAVLKRFECEDSDDLNKAYGSFDTIGTRSLPNLVAMKAASLDIDWPLRTCGLVVSAAAILEGMQQAHKTLKVDLLRPYLRIGRFINLILHETLPEQTKWKDIAHLARSPVAACMMLTYQKCQSDSERFWTDVRNGEDLKKTMPAFKVREFLKESNFDRGRGASGNNRRTVSQHEMMSRCITGWNAFRKKLRTDLKYYPNKPIPKAG